MNSSVSGLCSCFCYATCNIIQGRYYLYLGHYGICAGQIGFRHARKLQGMLSTCFLNIFIDVKTYYQKLIKLLITYINKSYYK